jgi:hypothetical protein
LALSYNIYINPRKLLIYTNQPYKFIYVVYGRKCVQNLRLKIYPKSFGLSGASLSWSQIQLQRRSAPSSSLIVPSSSGWCCTDIKAVLALAGAWHNGFTGDRLQGQGCQIFLETMYQTKYTK